MKFNCLIILLLRRHYLSRMLVGLFPLLVVNSYFKTIYFYLFGKG